MVSGETVKILDFGLAKLASQEGRKTLTDDSRQTAAFQTAPGVILGTVGYMSPEQASGQALDFRSDQFSLGLVLYEMVTGNRPFQRTDGGTDSDRRSSMKIPNRSAR